MTERERWIVYPLLFLALGAALRDKLMDRDGSRRIVCQELTITDGDTDGRYPPRVYAQLGRTEPAANSPAHGYLVVNGEVGVNGIISVNGAVNAGQYLHLIPRGQQPAGAPPSVAPAAPRRANPSGTSNQPSSSAPAESSDSNSSDEPSKSTNDESPAKD